MFDKDLIKKWLSNGIDEETIIKAREWGEKLARPKGNFRDDKREGLTQSQIRNVFGELRRIQIAGYSDENSTLKEISSFLMLEPKFAYLSKRHDKQGIKLFNELFKVSFDSLEIKNSKISKKKFNNFMELMEAVLAYHKFYSYSE